MSHFLWVFFTFHHLLLPVCSYSMNLFTPLKSLFSMAVCCLYIHTLNSSHLEGNKQQQTNMQIVFCPENSSSYHPAFFLTKLTFEKSNLNPRFLHLPFILQPFWIFKLTSLLMPQTIIVFKGPNLKTTSHLILLHFSATVGTIISLSP